MTCYNIFSGINKACVTYPLHEALLKIFNEPLKENILDNISFELSGSSLSAVEISLREVIQSLLVERKKEIINKFRPNEIDGVILGKEYILDLNNPIESLLYWYGSIHDILQEAVNENHPVKFIFDDGGPDKGIPVNLLRYD